MTAWHEGPMVALDFESTGVDTDTARIVTACVAVIEPGMPVTPKTWLQVRNDGVPAHQAVEEIAAMLTTYWCLDEGWPVVGFNLVYDLTLLDRELRRHGKAPLDPGYCIDAFVLDKHVSYRRGPRKLVDQCQHYGVRIDGAHDATADALAAARVAWRIAQRYPTVAEKTLAELHDSQVQWAAEQAATFREYLINQGKTQDLPHGEWPMRAWVDPAVAA